jgi:Tfp pilus assembly protein PilF
MRSLSFLLTLAVVLLGCSAAAPDLRTDQHLCQAVEEGARADINLDACSTIIANSSSRQERINAYNFRGVIYSTTGRESLAMADFNEALRIAPEFSGAYNNRANLLSRQGQSDAAERDFQSAISSGPNNATAYNNYAWHLLEQGDYGAALALAEQAVALEPQKASNHDTMAHALMGVGRHAQAEEAFATAMALNGAEVIARYQKALDAKGYAPGRSDGVLDPATRAALAACVRDNCRLLLD